MRVGVRDAPCDVALKICCLCLVLASIYQHMPVFACTAVPKRARGV